MAEDRKQRYSQHLKNFSFDSLSLNLRNIIFQCFKLWDEVPLTDREHLMDNINEYIHSQETINQDIMMLFNYAMHSLKDIVGGLIILAIVVALLVVVGLLTIIYIAVRIIIFVVYRILCLLRYLFSFIYHRKKD